MKMRKKRSPQHVNKTEEFLYIFFEMYKKL